MALNERWKVEVITPMTTPKEALRPFAACVFNDNGDVTIDTSHLRTEDYIRAKSVLASLQGEDAVERVAVSTVSVDLLQNERNVSDMLRSQADGYRARIAELEAKVDMQAATGLVPDEAAIRADEREKCAKVADSKQRSVRQFSVAADIAVAIRSGDGE